MNYSTDLPRPDRRTAIKWMLTASASTTLLSSFATATPSTEAAPVTGSGYGTDPRLQKTYQPGELWPLTLSEAQRVTAAALCAVIIPADATSPSAAQLHVHDFIDEWISAPYPTQALDRTLILDCLKWIEAEAQRRFGRNFPTLTDREKTAICDDVCFVKTATPAFADAAKLFTRFRDLTAGGFYTTPEGMKDLGYIGNIPLASFDGPPPEVLKKLGLL
ncbi:MAG: gluconate 2-dehydrogenase subunit 3 family protein [Opitutaceae bacterium]